MQGQQGQDALVEVMQAQPTALQRVAHRRDRHEALARVHRDRLAHRQRPREALLLRHYHAHAARVAAQVGVGRALYQQTESSGRLPGGVGGGEGEGGVQRAVEDARDGGGVHEDAVRQRGSQLQTHARGGVDGDGDGEGPSGFDDGEVRDGRAARKQLDFGRREHGLWE